MDTPTASAPQAPVADPPVAPPAPEAVHPAPPPEAADDGPTPDSIPKQAANSQSLKPGGKRSQSTTTAMVATVIIVLGLALLITIAYIKTKS